MDHVQRILLKVGDKTWSIIQAPTHGEGVYGSKENMDVEILRLNDQNKRWQGLNFHGGEVHSYVDGAELLKLLKAELEGD